MNSILFWNEVAMEANKETHTMARDMGTIGPTLSSRAFAIVHLAMYDAYAAVRKSLGAKIQPNGFPAQYLSALPDLQGANDALEAAAGAAFTALVALYPSQKVFFEEKKKEAGIPSGGSPSSSFSFGVAVARKLLDLRRFDPDNPFSFHYRASPERGRHRLDPDNPDQGYYTPFYGALSQGFAITGRHGLKAPPQPGTAAYIAALEQVRYKGIKPELTATLPPPAAGESRTPTETLIGLYWGYDGSSKLGTPPRLYNQIVRQVAMSCATGEATKDNDDHARLFALVNAAMGDAGILAWDQKYLHDFWRPVLGIREHDPSLGPAATTPSDRLLAGSDTGWLPLGAPASNTKTGAKNFTPNFPAYPSGHATFGAAALHMARLFYGVPKGDRNPDKLFENQSFVSEEFNGTTTDNLGTVRPRHERKFDGGLWQMIVENGESRVYLGVHWLFDAFALDKHGKLEDGLGGVPLGLTIAEDIWGGGKGLRQSKVGPRDQMPPK